MQEQRLRRVEKGAAPKRGVEDARIRKGEGNEPQGRDYVVRKPGQRPRGGVEAPKGPETRGMRQRGLPRRNATHA